MSKLKKVIIFILIFCLLICFAFLLVNTVTKLIPDYKEKVVSFSYNNSEYNQKTEVSSVTKVFYTIFKKSEFKYKITAEELADKYTKTDLYKKLKYFVMKESYIKDESQFNIRLYALAGKHDDFGEVILIGNSLLNFKLMYSINGENIFYYPENFLDAVESTVTMTGTTDDSDNDNGSTANQETALTDYAKEQIISQSKEYIEDLNIDLVSKFNPTSLIALNSGYLYALEDLENSITVYYDSAQMKPVGFIIGFK